MKIHCTKLECSVCGKVGLAQIFLTKQSKISYARIRHYEGTDPTTKKLKFTYHKIENSVQLESLISEGLQSKGEAPIGQSGLDQNQNNHDLKLSNLSLISKSEGRVAQHGQSTSLLSWGSWVQIPPRPLLLICSLILSCPMNCLLRIELLGVLSDSQTFY
jgi:hypothetical protein